MPPLMYQESDSSHTLSSAGGSSALPLVSSPTKSLLSSPSKTSSSFSSKAHRQHALARVKHTFKQTVARSPFLQQKPSSQRLESVAYFARREIQTGRLLGAGGFCEVYEITGFDLDDGLSQKVSSRNQMLRKQFQTASSGRYVLKHLRPDQAQGSNFASAAADLLLEASLLLRLDHPHILKLHGLPAGWWNAYEDGSHDGFFLILDRLGGTLDERIDEWAAAAATEQQQDDDVSVSSSSTHKQRQDHQDTTKMQYSLQLASALEYLHSNRLIYRDLKPCNVGFSLPPHDGNDGLSSAPQFNSKVVLFDFGLCRELPPHASTKTGTYDMSCVGTKRYQAPEVLWEAQYNCKADIYGWALVAWEMFALVRPYSSYELRQHAKYVIQGHERPPLVDVNEQKSNNNNNKKYCHDVPLGTIPMAMRPLLYKGWKAKVAERSDMQSLRRELEGIVGKLGGGLKKKRSSLLSSKSLQKRSSSILSRLSWSKNADH